MGKIKVTETLLAGDLPADVIPHMIWEEVLMGTRRRTVFLEGYEVTERLVGAMGTKISVPALSTRFTAGTISESTLDSSGYTVSDPTITDTDISIGNQVYVAARLSDILREDQPTYNWVRIILQDMGRAIAEYRDAALRDTLLAGAGNTQTAAAAGTLAFDDVIDGLALAKNDSFFPEDGTPFLFIGPNQEADVIKDTRYYDSKRYQQGDLPMLAANREAVEPVYASCRVRVSDNMTDALGLIVFPPTHKFAPIAIHALKRRLTVKSDREELYGRELWVASIRYGQAVVSANGVVLITNC
jgi:hypothetical protein